MAPELLQAQNVHYVAQKRTIGAGVRDEYFLTEPPCHVITSDSKHAEAPDFGPFDAAVSASAEGTGFGSGYSNVFQHSRLDPDGIRVSGDWSNYAASNEGLFSFGRLADATFDVADGPVHYDLAYSLRDPSTRGYFRAFELSLRRVGGDGADVLRVVPQYDPDSYIAAGSGVGHVGAGAV